MMSHQITPWLRDQDEVLSRCLWIELRHITVAEYAQPVQRWSFDQSKLDELIAALSNKATHYTQVIGSGPQRFAVALLDEAEHVLGQHVMRIASDVVGGLSYDSEPASIAGVTKQLMRHNEALMKGTASAQARVVEQLLRENERLSKHCEGLEDRHMQLVELAEGMLSQQAERELQAERHRNSERRRDKILEQLSTLLPAALTRMSGKPVAANLDPALRALATSMDLGQLRQLASVLRPEQLFALTAVLEKVTDVGNAEDKAGQGDEPADLDHEGSGGNGVAHA